MTNPMIEKVARAIYEICNDGGPWNDEEWAEMKASDDPRKTGWRSHFLHMARAAIEAMREPSEAMNDALDRVPGAFGRGAWLEGIDAALREGEK